MMYFPDPPSSTYHCPGLGAQSAHSLQLLAPRDQAQLQRATLFPKGTPFPGQPESSSTARRHITWPFRPNAGHSGEQVLPCALQHSSVQSLPQHLGFLHTLPRH